MYRKLSGFTLMEVMVTVAIVGIVAAIAYPSYRDAIIKSRRSEATTKLLDLAQRQGRFYTAGEPSTYTTNLADLGFANGDYYTISAAATAGSTIASSYTLTATPVGTQAGDAECANFTLTSTNVKGISGSGTVGRCW